MTSLGWQDRARCAGTASEVFFPDGGDTRRAKAFCAGCPVWSECLLFGLDEDHGVWGGLNRAERTRLRRLCERLSTAPTDRANAADIKRLISVGFDPARLSAVSGLAVETIMDVVADSSDRQTALGARVGVPRSRRRGGLATVGAVAS